MKSWTDTPHNNFTIDFFLDTNLLVYLLDNTYSSLKKFIDLVNENNFSQLVSSKYVIFELVGVRKKEHYLRVAASNADKTPEGIINISSLLKYRDQFNNPHAVFDEEIEGIRNIVKQEIEKITTEFQISFDEATFHDDQLEPTIDICLSSELSNQDSLVLVSSSLPQPNEPRSPIFLTNDSQFASAYKNTSSIEEVFKAYSLLSPTVYKMDDLPRHLKLIGKVVSSDEEIERNFNAILIDFLIKKNSDTYLGKTFEPEDAEFPNDCICFKLKPEKALINGCYITIISKNLDFIYTSRNAISFWFNGNQIENGFIAQEGNNNISYKIIETDEEGNQIQISTEKITNLRETGNLVFIHPDSEAF